VTSAANQGEYDKRLKLITANGVIYALMKGVRRPKAKLKPFAVPFSFCEYSVAKSGEFYTITGAVEIENFHCIAACNDKLVAASISLEAASCSFSSGSEKDFILLLKTIKNIIYTDTPYLHTIKFIQHMIHSGGYYYEYEKYDKLQTPLELLSHLYYSSAICHSLSPACHSEQREASHPPKDLVQKTLVKIIHSFENKFDCQLKSKNFI